MDSYELGDATLTQVGPNGLELGAVRQGLAHLHGWALASPDCGDIGCPPNSQSDADLYATDDGGTNWAEVALPGS